MKSWWVTGSEGSEGGYHWNSYLTSSGGEYEWGGAKWIKSPHSFTCIEEMRKGDVIVAYQASEGILGLGLLSGDGYQEKTEGPYNIFPLSSSKLRLKEQIPLDAIRALPHARSSFEFLAVLRGSVFKIEKKGFDRLIGLLLAYNPSQHKQIRSFLQKAKAELPYKIA